MTSPVSCFTPKAVDLARSFRLSNTPSPDAGQHRSEHSNWTFRAMCLFSQVDYQASPNMNGPRLQLTPGISFAPTQPAHRGITRMSTNPFSSGPHKTTYPERSLHESTTPCPPPHLHSRPLSTFSPLAPGATPAQPFPATSTAPPPHLPGPSPRTVPSAAEMGQGVLMHPIIQ